MPEARLLWVDDPGLAGLDPAAVAAAAGVALTSGEGGALVLPVPRSAMPERLRHLVSDRPAVFIDLAGEVGGGEAAHRLARAGAAVARAAGQAAKGTMPPRYTPQPAQTVLVAGAGLAALAAAREAAALGHPVLLATPLGSATEGGQDDDPQAMAALATDLPAGVEVATATELSDLSGAGGDFSADLTGPQGAYTQRFGAVVIAPPGAWRVADQAPATPLHQVDPEAVAGEGAHWTHAAVLAGVETPLGAEAFQRAVEMALALQARPSVQAALFFSEARVATEDGERRYRQARTAGVLPVRVAPGGLAVGEGGKRLSWRDPVLDDDLTLEPDLVVGAEEVSAVAPAFLNNQLRWPAWEALVPENPRFSGGRTARSGLYITGALRGTPPGPARLTEAADAAADLHGLLGGRATPIPGVVHTYCASCLTCVRVCPHGVPRFPQDQVICAPAACVACGICAAECPAEAIAPPGWSNPEMIAALEAGLAQAQGDKMVLFACGQSAWPAFAGLSRAGHTWPAGLVVVPLNCAGRVGEQLILKALSLGARAVLVAGCHDGNCRSISGNRRARLRTGQAAELIGGLGLDPEAVRFLHLASNQPGELAAAVEALAARAAGE